MDKELARKTWMRFLDLAIRGQSGVYLENPFCRDSATAYKGLSGDECLERLDGYKQQSFMFWQGRPKLSLAQLLINALETTKISDECLEKITDLLAEASVNTIYFSGDEHQKYEPHNDIAQEEDEGMGFSFWRPKDIEEWLHTTGGIVGQNAAVKAASLILYAHNNKRPSVSLFAAPTGSGKTQIWRALQRACGADNIIIQDASALTAEGWKGDNKISTIFKNIPARNRGHIILVLDEFDKLLEPQYGSGGTNYTDIIQNQLLKLCDHDTLFFGNNKDDGITVDTSGISIVMLGAFQRLMDKKTRVTGSIGFGGEPHHTCNYTNAEITIEDLVEYGMREELAGRITRITCMNPLTVDDLMCIGQNEIKNLEERIYRKIEVDHNVLLSLAVTAKEKGLGARWLKSQLNNMLDELVYEDPDSEEYVISFERFIDMTSKTSPTME